MFPVDRTAFGLPAALRHLSFDVRGWDGEVLALSREPENGPCSPVYRCLKNAVGLQNTAKYCKQTGPSNRISNERIHAVSRFCIWRIGSAMHRVAP
jgi:hypothetical protein